MAEQEAPLDGASLVVGSDLFKVALHELDAPGGTVDERDQVAVQQLIHAHMQPIAKPFGALQVKKGVSQYTACSARAIWGPPSEKGCLAVHRLCLCHDGMRAIADIPCEIGLVRPLHGLRDAPAGFSSAHAADNSRPPVMSWLLYLCIACPWLEPPFRAVPDVEPSSISSPCWGLALGRLMVAEVGRPSVMGMEGELRAEAPGKLYKVHLGCAGTPPT
eukprot:CAMPEP_0202392568 /NCGR_PEP_ID=MMETSP1127-20130417/92446_1 /ASSEMBLY_ACC=CAM_ASM_000462 /TAXON_ID=3047 /ORGANISM="Dunaliella tertiolecta, Strain CCMP1320" /LENGTH=217 /DNA_ID=CAMNT_0048995089 /DNA_START=898 /DNA_END=1554 /DNA_ORIENTATION=+